MLFNTWTFAAFLLPVWVLYHARATTRWQIGVLITSSFIFYGWGIDPTGFARWQLIPLLAFSCFINSIASRQLLRPGTPIRRRRHILYIALATNLAVLAFFKYAALLGQTLLPASWWTALSPWLGNIPLPVGISFYTFQGISLVVDAYRSGTLEGLTPTSKDDSQGKLSSGAFHSRVWFFKAFFPQLVAGPIVKASEFFHQIRPKYLADIDWDGAIRKLILGFFLKMVVADNLREATQALAWPHFESLSSPTLILLLYAFSFQIFADFAGYSLIAQGLGKLFGYELPLNFNHPYLAASLTEFWRRWHLSLSSWLREYLYVPLGGNRKGALRTYFNLFIVMLLGGLWHGAAWSYAAWGFAHGFGLAIERAIGIGRGPELSDWRFLRILRAILTFHIVSFLWLLFQLPEFNHVLAYVRCVVSQPGPPLPQYVFVTVLFSLPVLIHHLWEGTSNFRLNRIPAHWNRRGETVAYGLMLALLPINSGAPGAFIYFQF